MCGIPLSIPTEEEITSIVKQLITSSRQSPPDLKVRRNAVQNFFSHPRERHDRGCGDRLVCERNTFKITDDVTGGDHRHQFRNDLKAYRDDMQRTSAACSFSTVEGIQQVSRSRQCSRRRCGRTLRIDQTVNTIRPRRGAGTHVYNPHLLDNRSMSSSVRKAGALVSPSSCLDGEPHGWVPVDTHSAPVPSSTGEAVGGLCSPRAQ